MIKNDHHNVSNDKKTKKNTLAALIIVGLALSLALSPVLGATTHAFGVTYQNKQNEQEQLVAMEGMQALTTEHLTEEESTFNNGIQFTPRWGDASFVQAGKITVLFADCLPGEFAVSSQFMFGSANVNALESYPVALPDSTMMWMLVVKNIGEGSAPASAGVICVGDSGSERFVLDKVDKKVRVDIHNAINNIIKVEGDQITNINQVINIRQKIIQNVVTIINNNITNNVNINNTITNIVNQTVNSIINNNITNINEINQVFNQTVIEQQSPITPDAGAPEANATAAIITTPAIVEQQEEQQQEEQQQEEEVIESEQPQEQDGQQGENDQGAEQEEQQQEEEQDEEEQEELTRQVDQPQEEDVPSNSNDPF